MLKYGTVTWAVMSENMDSLERTVHNYDGEMDVWIKDSVRICTLLSIHYSECGSYAVTSAQFVRVGEFNSPMSSVKFTKY